MLTVCIITLVVVSAGLAVVSGIWVAGGLIKELLRRE
jgi:hypothetical protein